MLMVLKQYSFVFKLLFEKVTIENTCGVFLLQKNFEPKLRIYAARMLSLHALRMKEDATVITYLHFVTIFVKDNSGKLFVI